MEDESKPSSASPSGAAPMSALSPEQEAQMARDYASIYEQLQQLDHQVGRFTSLMERHVVNSIPTLEYLHTLWQGEAQLAASGMPQSTDDDAAKPTTSSQSSTPH
jgi:uncharacterized protein YbjT (DUF2867 family)